MGHLDMNHKPVCYGFDNHHLQDLQNRRDAGPPAGASASARSPAGAPPTPNLRTLANQLCSLRLALAGSPRLSSTLILLQRKDTQHGRAGTRHYAGEGSHRAAGVMAPSARSDATLPAGGRALSEASRPARGRGSSAATVRGRRVRRLSQVRFA